jgi:transcriptional regulator with XRE-family HTH domain
MTQTGSEEHVYLVVMPGSTNDTSGRLFARVIRDGRARLGWTQDDLIDESGVSRATILRWEAGGVRNPNPENVRAVCAALGLDVREAIVALGLATREELELPPPVPKLAAALERAQRLLLDPKIPDEMKRDLETLIDTSIDFWYQRQGVTRPPREPSAAERAGRKPTAPKRR